MKPFSCVLHSRYSLQAFYEAFEKIGTEEGGILTNVSSASSRVLVT